MISLLPAIERLTSKPQGFELEWLRRVGGAAEYAQISAESLPLPAAWIVRDSDKVTDAGEAAEDTEFGFDVVIAIANVRSHTPGDTDEILLQYRRAIKTLLLGWQIEPDTQPIRWKGGRVLQYTDGDIYWADKYSFKALVTNYLPDPPLYESTTYIGDGL